MPSQTCSSPYMAFGRAGHKVMRAGELSLPPVDAALGRVVPVIYLHSIVEWDLVAKAHFCRREHRRAGPTTCLPSGGDGIEVIPSFYPTASLIQQLGKPLVHERGRAGPAPHSTAEGL